MNVLVKTVLVSFEVNSDSSQGLGRFASLQLRNAVPICTADDPNAINAAIPRPSIIPPEEITGISVLLTI